MFLRQSGAVAALMLASVFANAEVLSAHQPYYPADFYAGVEGGMLKDTALKNELFQILSEGHVPGANGANDTLQDHCANGADMATCYQHVVLGYNPARKILFGEIHLVKTDDGYGVFDVYCQVMDSTDDFHGKQSPGPGQIPDINILNTEHTWPQSQFSHKFPADMQKSDLHNLYPVSEKANSTRSSFKFGNVTATTQQPCAAAKLGHGPAGNDLYFEAPDQHKGNVARAIFYFSVRYQMPIPADEQATLRAWNKMDPPDDFERQRNDGVFKHQHDRNPFIDYPELVDMISDF